MEATTKQRWRQWSKLQNPRYIRSEEAWRLSMCCNCAWMWPWFTLTLCSTKCEPTFRWNRPKPVKGKSSLWWTLPATWVWFFFLFPHFTSLWPAGSHGGVHSVKQQKETPLKKFTEVKAHHVSLVAKPFRCFTLYVKDTNEMIMTTVHMADV